MDATEPVATGEADAKVKRGKRKRTRDRYVSSFPISVFCERNGISRALYYKLKKIGKIPREIMAGVILITVEAEAEWKRERARDRQEAAATADAKRDPAEAEAP